jgi:integrase
LITFLTIGAFAGLRTAEIERLDWSKIDFKSNFITVDASIAKTNSRRLIPIQPNLKAWHTDAAALATAPASLVVCRCRKNR